MGGRRFKEKKEAVEPEADPERDQRTVFAYQVDGLHLCLVLLEMIIRHGIVYIFILAISYLLILCALMLWFGDDRCLWRQLREMLMNSSQKRARFVAFCFFLEFRSCVFNLIVSFCVSFCFEFVLFLSLCLRVVRFVAWENG